MDKILLVNKDKGYTSRDVVNCLSKVFHTNKMGHFGTLDPLATGLLIIGIGKYTKVGNLFESDDKEYVAEALIGTSTDTYDVTGTVTKKVDIKEIDKDIIINVLNKYRGLYLQEVPIYSAVKVDGKKLYEYARKGESVTLPKKLVNIRSIELIDIYEKDNKLYFSFRCNVSKGTYIRSLINDMGKSINIPMCMSNLKRTKQDKFSLDDAYTIKDIKNGNYKLLDIEDVIDLDVVEVPNSLYDVVKNGGLIKKTGDKPILFRRNGKNIALYMDYDKNKNTMKPFIFYGGK